MQAGSGPGEPAGSGKRMLVAAVDNSFSMRRGGAFLLSAGQFPGALEKSYLDFGGVTAAGA